MAALLAAGCSTASGDAPADGPGNEADGGGDAPQESQHARDGAEPDRSAPPPRPDGPSREAAPDAAADPPHEPWLDAPAWQPPAKGLWIWYFDYIGLSPDEAAARAQSFGVGYVLIKSGQDARFWSTRYDAETVAAFTSRGMRVYAWPYVTPDDVPGAVAAAALAAAVPGTSGLVLDVESEWETNTHAADAAALCDGIRDSTAPGTFLAFTSFGWPGFHPGFPWRAFDAGCGDAFFPQIYWADRGVAWASGYAEARKQIDALALRAPVWPVQSNDDVWSTPAGPSTDDLNAFFDAAGVFTSLWEYPSSQSPDKHAQLPLLHWKNP